jgi:hypothetical protein
MAYVNANIIEEVRVEQDAVILKIKRDGIVFSNSLDLVWVDVRQLVTSEQRPTCPVVGAEEGEGSAVAHRGGGWGLGDGAHSIRKTLMPNCLIQLWQ